MMIWRRLFPILQRKIPAYRHHKILGLLDRVATVYHAMYENGNSDFVHNGESWVVRRLHDCGHLSVVFDVGANIGDYARLVRSISPSCKIVAFEPVPATYAKLEARKIGGDITLVNAALGEKSGPAQIAVPDDSTIASLLVDKQGAAGRRTRPETIQVERGDSYLARHPQITEISLLKVDTEGFEPWVLKGFGEQLKTASVIQFEYGRANLFAKYFLHDYFESYGRDFLIGKIYPRGVVFHETYNWDLDDLLGPNYLMVNRNRLDLVEALHD